MSLAIFMKSRCIVTTAMRHFCTRPRLTPLPVARAILAVLAASCASLAAARSVAFSSGGAIWLVESDGTSLRKIPQPEGLPAAAQQPQSKPAINQSEAKASAGLKLSGPYAWVQRNQFMQSGTRALFGDHWLNLGASWSPDFMKSTATDGSLGWGDNGGNRFFKLSTTWGIQRFHPVGDSKLFAYGGLGLGYLDYAFTDSLGARRGEKTLFPTATLYSGIDLGGKAILAFRYDWVPRLRGLDFSSFGITVGVRF